MGLDGAIRLSEAQPGDQLYLLSVQQKRALRWLIQHGISDEVSLLVTSMFPNGVRLTSDGQLFTVPAWVARQTVVHRFRKVVKIGTQ